jgi:hypothetical protein
MSCISGSAEVSGRFCGRKNLPDTFFLPDTLFFDNTVEEAVARARTAHPADDVWFTRYVPAVNLKGSAA